jgi:dTDP-4-amino-4,6-dideoxygalactose transaminase
MVQPGFNYRLPDIACALGISQMGKLPRFAERRRRLAALYGEALAPLAPLVTLPPPMPWSDPVLHLLCVLIDFEAAGLTRRAVMEGLTARGIGSQVHYIPVHTQPYWRARNGALSLPGAEGWYARCLSLPLYPGMDDGDVERVVTALRETLAF